MKVRELRARLDEFDEDLEVGAFHATLTIYKDGKVMADIRPIVYGHGEQKGSK